MKNSITIGIASNNNWEALNLTLQSVFNQTVFPERLILRLDGTHKPNFYFEQLLNWAKLLNIDVDILNRCEKGVRVARQDLVDNCKTKWLWMLDDDCTCAPECYHYFLLALEDIGKTRVGFICGSKGDVANLRGYNNFELEIKNDPQNDDNQNCFNHFYGKNYAGDYKYIVTLDTGNVLLNLDLMSEKRIRFDNFLTYNCGGEDTVLALQFYKNDLTGIFAPLARVYHLEKPNIRFNEFAARKAYVKEVALNELKLSKADWEEFEKEFMEWVK